MNARLDVPAIWTTGSTAAITPNNAASPPSTITREDSRSAVTKTSDTAKAGLLNSISRRVQPLPIRRPKR